jgi:hypothetical protein
MTDDIERDDIEGDDLDRRHHLCDKLSDLVNKLVDKLTEDELNLVIEEHLPECMESLIHIHGSDVDQVLLHMMEDKSFKKDLVSTHWYRLITEKF